MAEKVEFVQCSKDYFNKANKSGLIDDNTVYYVYENSSRTYIYKGTTMYSGPEEDNKLVLNIKKETDGSASLVWNQEYGD